MRVFQNGKLIDSVTGAPIPRVPHDITAVDGVATYMTIADAASVLGVPPDRLAATAERMRLVHVTAEGDVLLMSALEGLAEVMEAEGLDVTADWRDAIEPRLL